MKKFGVRRNTFEPYAFLHRDLEITCKVNHYPGQMSNIQRSSQLVFLSTFFAYCISRIVLSHFICVTDIRQSLWFMFVHLDHRVVNRVMTSRRYIVLTFTTINSYTQEQVHPHCNQSQCLPDEAKSNATSIQNMSGDNIIR